MIGRRRVEARTWARIRDALGGSEDRSAWIRHLLMEERSIPRSSAEQPDLLAALVALRLVRDGPLIRPLVRFDRLGGLALASDLMGHRHAPDYVVRPGPASRTLARFVRADHPRPVLDLGCGSGVQGLLAAGPATRVTAIDINPRAVAMTRFNASINGRRSVVAEVGDFLGLDPDRRLDGRFGTAIANPPFVLAPTATHTYRDRPLPRDEVGARTIERVARALAPGGRGYVLCNWIADGRDWSDPVRAWVRAAGRDGVAVRLATLDAAAYAAFWTRDLEPTARAAAAAEWRTALAAEAVADIHLGVIALARSTGLRAARPRFEALDAVSTPVGTEAVEASLAA